MKRSIFLCGYVFTRPITWVLWLLCASMTCLPWLCFVDDGARDLLGQNSAAERAAITQTLLEGANEYDAAHFARVLDLEESAAREPDFLKRLDFIYQEYQIESRNIVNPEGNEELYSAFLRAMIDRKVDTNFVGLREQPVAFYMLSCLATLPSFIWQVPCLGILFVYSRIQDGTIFRKLPTKPFMTYLYDLSLLLLLCVILNALIWIPAMLLQSPHTLGRLDFPIVFYTGSGLVLSSVAEQLILASTSIFVQNLICVLLYHLLQQLIAKPIVSFISACAVALASIVPTNVFRLLPHNKFFSLISFLNLATFLKAPIMKPVDTRPVLYNFAGNLHLPLLQVTLLIFLLVAAAAAQRYISQLQKQI